jgi:hypothetical protein
MKKLLLLVGLLMGFGACSKKDDPAPTPATSPYSQLLLGKWDTVSAEATIPQLTGPPITTLVTYPVGRRYDVFTATTVESFDFYGVSQRIEAYMLSGSVYTTTQNGVISTYEIKELTATRLVINYSYPTRTMDGRAGTAVVVYTYTR